MKYMLIMNSPRDGYDQYMSWPKKILEANAAFVRNFTDKLHASGELVGAEGLASPKEALRVRAGKDGKPITDGAFAESKEFLAGHWVIDVDCHGRALEIAAEASTAPRDYLLKKARGTEMGQRSSLAAPPASPVPA
jgi:hypothetical protein